MGKLIVTPLKEPFENRMKALFRMPLQVTVYRDIARVADFFGQVRRLVNIFWFKVGIFLFTFQDAKIHSNTQFIQRLINKARMA